MMNEFSGVNKKCAICTQECKQWKQVVVVVCPNFDRLENSVGITQGKTREKPVVERYLRSGHTLLGKEKTP